MTAARRSAVDRRAQLVEIGLELLPTTPVQELTIDEVARRAGISRSLLFHYFPTKRDYYTAVTRAAARALEEHLLAGGEPGAAQVPGMLDRYVGWVETFRESHLAFVRGAAGGDPWVAEVYEETRERLGDVARAPPDPPADAPPPQLPPPSPTPPAAASWSAPGSRSPRTWSASGPGSRRPAARSCWRCCATCSTG